VVLLALADDLAAARLATQAAVQRNGWVPARAAWFVESRAAQALVVFVIRTRRVPFVRSRPSRPLLLTTLAVVLVGLALPYSPLASILGFRSLPWLFLVILSVLAVTYLGLAELGKAYFYRREATQLKPSPTA